ANAFSLQHNVKPFLLATKVVRFQVALLPPHIANVTTAKNGLKRATPTLLTPLPYAPTTIATFTTVTGRYAKSMALRTFNQLPGSTQPVHYYATCTGIHNSGRD